MKKNRQAVTRMLHSMQSIGKENSIMPPSSFYQQYPTFHAFQQSMAAASLAAFQERPASWQQAHQSDRDTLHAILAGTLDFPLYRLIYSGCPQCNTPPKVVMA